MPSMSGLGVAVVLATTLAIGTVRGAAVGSVTSKPEAAVVTAAGLRAFINLEKPDPNVPEGELDFDWSFCEKKIRIAFYVQPPFIIVDPTKCKKDPQDESAARLCPPEAFGDKPSDDNKQQPMFDGGGGLTYEIITNSVVPHLENLCNPETQLEINNTDTNTSQSEGSYKRVMLDWYLLDSDPTSVDAALALLCNGGWTAKDSILTLDAQTPDCPSATSYKGLTDQGNSTCTHATDPTCRSSGPDIAVGAISITRARYDIVDFSMPYYIGQQTVIIRPPEFSMDISGYLNIFLPFDESLWLAIFVEVLAMWVLIMIIEGDIFTTSPPVNETVSPEWEDRFYDCFYWSFGSLMDPGGPGKGPVTWGGKILLISHWFFVTIVASTYTGAVGAFLATSSATPVVEGYASLQGGLFGVVVPGPTWNSSIEEPAYRGNYKGGVADSNSTSSQFEIIQNTMKASSAAVFNLYTTKSYDTRLPPGASPTSKDLCKMKDVELGAYDYLICKAGDGVKEPQAMIADETAANFELWKRKRETGSCPLLTVGTPFSVSGIGIAFPKNSLYSNVFSRALNDAMMEGEVEALIDKYDVEESACHQEIEEGGDVMGVNEIAGLFLITMIMIGASIVHGVLTQVHCPYPKGYTVPYYEEELSVWSDVPEEGLKERLFDLKRSAYNVERLSGELSEALRTGTPFSYDPDANPDSPPEAVAKTESDEQTRGPLSAILNIDLPFGL